MQNQQSTEGWDAIKIATLATLCLGIGMVTGVHMAQFKAAQEAAIVLGHYDLCPEFTKLAAQGQENILGRWDTYDKDAVFVWQVCEIAPGEGD